MRVGKHSKKGKTSVSSEGCWYGQIFMELSESSGNQKSMWTKLPAALRRIAAVHHCTLCDTFHQLNTKHDKDLLRNKSLFNSVQYSEVPHKKAENCISTHVFARVQQRTLLNWKVSTWGTAVDSWENVKAQILSHDRTYNHKSHDGRWCTLVAWVTEIQGPVFAELQHPLGAARDFFWKANSQCSYFTNLDCVGEWPDGRRQQPGVCRKAVKDSKYVTQKAVVWLNEHLRLAKVKWYF